MRGGVITSMRCEWQRTEPCPRRRWQGLAAQDVLSKIVAVFLPIFTFVALAFDHVGESRTGEIVLWCDVEPRPSLVANMLFIPLALMLGADFGAGKCNFCYQ